MRLTLFTAAAVLAATSALAGSETAGEGKQADATDTVLLTQALEGMEGKVVNVVRTEVPPGWQTPRHSHPGNVFVYVLDGAIEVALEGGETHTASAGEIIYETPNRAMVGRNASSTEGARILVFHVGDAGDLVTVPEE